MIMYGEQLFKKELQEKLQKKDLTFLIGIGGDTLKTYVIVEGFSEEAKRTEGYKKLEEKIRKAVDRVIQKAGKFEVWYSWLKVEKTNIRTGLYNILHDDGTWGRVSYFNEYIQEALREIEEEERKRKEEKKKRQEEIEKMRRKALEEAKRTGREVIIRAVGGYDGDSWEDVRMWGTKEIIRKFKQGGELGWVTVYEVATPDGRIIERHVPSY